MNSDWPVMSEDAAKQLAENRLQMYGQIHSGPATPAMQELFRHSFDEVEQMPVQLSFADGVGAKEWVESLGKAVAEANKQLQESMANPPVARVVGHNNGQRVSIHITIPDGIPTFTLETTKSLRFSAYTAQELAEEAGLDEEEAEAYHATLLAIKHVAAFTDEEAYCLHTILCKMASPFFVDTNALGLAKAMYKEQVGAL